MAALGGPFVWGGAALLGGAALSGKSGKRTPGRAHFERIPDDELGDAIDGQVPDRAEVHDDEPDETA